MYLCVCVCACTCHNTWMEVKGQPTCGNSSSPSTMLVAGIRLRLLGLGNQSCYPVSHLKGPNSKTTKSRNHIFPDYDKLNKEINYNNHLLNNHQIKKKCSNYYLFIASAYLLNYSAIYITYSIIYFHLLINHEVQYVQQR